MQRRPAAIRLRAKLQPIGGAGTYVQPPTYAHPTNKKEALIGHHHRRIDGEDVHCTLIGSVACMANRFEEALATMRSEGLKLSVARVDDNVGGYPLHESTLTMPHRGADAIARSCLVDGKPYMSTGPGKALLCNQSDVRPLAKWHQPMLLLGGWFSARSHGGIRIPRALSAEITAIRSVPCVTVGGRYDTTPTSKAVKVYRQPGNGIPFELEKTKKERKGDTDLEPSRLPIGMIPSGIEEHGVTADYYELVATVSLAAIRHLRCGEADAAPLHDALEKLGLAVLLRTVSDGVYLRSRCHLVPDGSPVVESILSDGQTSQIDLDVEKANKSASEAIEACVKSGIDWGNEEVTLEASEQLRGLIKKSLAVGGIEE